MLNAIVEGYLLSCFSVHVIILFFQLVNILLLKELDEVEEGMVSLRLFYLVMKLLRNTCHKELGEGLEVVPLLCRVEKEKSVAVD